jgi:hypothetical protein
VSTHFVLPETASKGRARLWRDPVVEDVVRRMHEGDPLLGWSGDERLGLYWGVKEPNIGRWLVIRFDEQGDEHIVCRSQPGAWLGGLIVFLAENDQRRRNALDINALMDKEDAAREEAGRNAERAAAEHFASQATRKRAPLGRRRNN